MTSIPIRNIYYLLCYAWDELEVAEELEIDTEALPHVSDLLARLIIHGTRSLLRRGMDRGYIAQTEELSTLRGRVDFGASTKRLLLEQGRAICSFEEFLPDLLHNRIIKTTIPTLAGTKDLALEQRRELRVLLRKMDGIGNLKLRKGHFAEVRLHRNNAHYRLLMHICELVYDNLLVNEQTGQRMFRNFLQDEKMAQLFERFVAKFYQKEKEPEWKVSPHERISWDTSTRSELLPMMEADVVMRSGRRTLVVECKFYEETLQSGQRSDKSKPKLRSGHLYQLSSYMENLRRSLKADDELEGLLVYPVSAVNTRIQEDLVLAGKRIRVRTLNLDDHWEQIKEQMGDFIKPWADQLLPLNVPADPPLPTGQSRI